MVDLETVRKIPNASPPFIRMGDDDDFVATVDKFCRELVDVAFNAAGLGEKEVADHGDIVRHLGGLKIQVIGSVWLYGCVDTS